MHGEGARGCRARALLPSFGPHALRARPEVAAPAPSVHHRWHDRSAPVTRDAMDGRRARPRGRPAGFHLGPRSARRRRRRGDRGARRGRAGRRPPRRGGRAPGRRTLRLTRPRRRRHDHRGRADRHPDGGRRRQELHAGPRHRLRGRDDHLQRHRRPEPARRLAAARARRLQRRGHRRRPRHRRDAGHAQPGAADLHHQQAGPGVLHRPAHLRRPRLARPVRPVRGDPDRAAPRLLPADHPAGRGHRRGRPRRRPVRPYRRHQPGPARPGPRRRGRSRQGRVARPSSPGSKRPACRTPWSA